MTIDLGKPHIHYKGGLYVPLHVGLLTDPAQAGEELVCYMSALHGTIHFRPVEIFQGVKLTGTFANPIEVRRFRPMDERDQLIRVDKP